LRLCNPNGPRQNQIHEVGLYVTEGKDLAYSPRDYAKPLVSLNDRVTGVVLRSFTAEAEAASHFLSDEYGIDAAFAELEKQILMGLR